jgi:hypothetical protein
MSAETQIGFERFGVSVSLVHHWLSGTKSLKEGSSIVAEQSNFTLFLEGDAGSF